MFRGLVHQREGSLYARLAPHCSIGMSVSFFIDYDRSGKVQICKNRRGIWFMVIRLRSSWTPNSRFPFAFPYWSFFPLVTESRLVGRVLFCGLASPLLNPQELKPDLSSPDSFPFSHNNFCSHASPHPQDPKVYWFRGFQDLHFASLWLWLFLYFFEKNCSLKVPSSLLTWPQVPYRVRMKIEREGEVGDPSRLTDSSWAAGDRQRREHRAAGEGETAGQEELSNSGSNEKM